MPLFPVSPNIQESESALRKRTHDDYIGDGALQVTVDYSSQSENPLEQKSLEMSASAVERQPQLAHVPSITMNSTPGSSPAALTDAGSSTPARDSPPPQSTPSRSPLLPMNTTPVTTASAATVAKTAQPKKRKLTTAEQEKERVEKKLKLEAAATEKARLTAEREAAKVAKAAEKAKLDAEKEAAKNAKAAEKAKLDAEKEAKKAKLEAEKEAKKRKKQQEDAAAQRKLALQAKQKNLMASFVKKAPSTPTKKDAAMVVDQAQPVKPSPENASPAALEEETKPTISPYDLMFKSFFVKDDMTVAPAPFQMDDETKQAKSNILDEYIRGERGEFDPKPFNAAATFDLAFPSQRGIVPSSVRNTMERVHGDPYETAFDIQSLRTEAQNAQLEIDAQDRLNTIPMKYLAFYEDVRPPYFGTMTAPTSVKQLRRLSRNPKGRILPLTYDYDSEAEWVEDDEEDGENLDDAEDEEEDVDGDEEMDDFVDDSEAVNVMRPRFEADNQPKSTGICYENRKRLGPCPTTYKFRFEFLLESLDHHSMINPFSSSYWPAPIKKSTGMSASGSKAFMPPPAVPGEASSSATKDKKDHIPDKYIEDFKSTLVSDECKEYSKATVIEMLAKKFASCTKAQVKATLDVVAHRVTPPDEKRKSVKHWVLLPTASV
ncbi:Uu.00g086180.m01.CDS01 [Anthostomella pinea]|uniref:Uu.00g086180.m01.CDS01 n=1 Tax=Anthostomella pinea TaxID=933095 RepID=A0AAI8VMQ5_9PEZI|nr:Uu.00g086180.m01.CDS01 [Anthostomella pinea]